VTADPVARSLARGIAEATGERFEVAATAPVGGGCIHTALEVTGRGAAGEARYFAKVNEADRADLFAAEADGLAALARAGAIAVPGVVAQGADDERAWLGLEWLERAPLDVRAGARLGAALAAQHAAAQPRFGWGRDNYIGATPQPNEWTDDWLAFWRGKRMVPQLRLAARNRLPSRMIDRGERLAADCGAFFSNHRPAKSLLHGDLWSGNAAMGADGAPGVFAPAVYVGDREADLAMTELFGGFPPDFQAAYCAALPPDDGYRTRRDFYNLYHVLNHANLFAGGYVRQAEQSIERLLAELG
jgi:fructosamine-3-kinase